MSFGGSQDEAALPQFKKFVSEEELDEKRKKRQEEWEKVRTPDQPLEAPEEEVDSRSLFDKLEEQKQKKQEEHDDKFKMSNQVKGLDTDEAKFLDFVSDRQQEVEKKRLQEDYEVIRECKNAMVTKVPERSTPITVNAAPPVSRPSSTSGQAKKSQAALLAGAVKRKGSQAENEDAKRKKADSPDKEKSQAVAASAESTATSKEQAEVIGVLPAGLPGMGAYSDSSDSDSETSDSDVDTDLFHHKGVIRIVEGGCGH